MSGCNCTGECHRTGKCGGSGSLAFASTETDLMEAIQRLERQQKTLDALKDAEASSIAIGQAEDIVYHCEKRVEFLTDELNKLKTKN